MKTTRAMIQSLVLCAIAACLPCGHGGSALAFSNNVPGGRSNAAAANFLWTSLSTLASMGSIGSLWDVPLARAEDDDGLEDDDDDEEVDEEEGDEEDDEEDDEEEDNFGQDEDADADGCILRNANGSCRMYSNVQHFRNDFGELEFKWSSCNDPYDENHDDFEEVAKENSLYQSVIFEENLVTEDKCLRLDATLQQCSTYRPHYHEPFVHLSASYLNNGFMSGISRVVFVGGGDSMLLHEILKYDHIEMVLGLELDQKVTRNSFEHFKTQPHFDNPKVQWWFGDGAKSLTLLPRSYFGTFQLVLLDLSETVMSMTVTKGLDVFGAMKLLLSPYGIMVKNDFGYFEKLSKVFDTCLQLVIPDVTYICDYELVLCSSEKIDLLNPTFYHMKGIETLVYDPMENVNNHWDPVTDFSKYWGEPRECSNETMVVDEESIAYAGVLMIVEAERVSMSLKDGEEVIKALLTPLVNLGYHVISTTSLPSQKSGGSTIAIVLKEGYILAETWPDASYCKLDIHLWGAFQKQADIRSEYLQALGSQTGDWSSYRIVVGGMRGTDTRSDDLKLIGPDLSKIGQCEEYSNREGGIPSSRHITLNSSYEDEEELGPIIDVGIEDIVTFMTNKAKSVSAVVICGIQTEDASCRAKQTLEKISNVNLITMWSCSEEESGDMMTKSHAHGQMLAQWRKAMNSDDITEFNLCGKSANIALREVATKKFGGGINVIVVDSTAPSEHVFDSHRFVLQFWKNLRKPFLMLVPILDASDEKRTFFLKSRYNKGDDEPEFYSQIFVGNKSVVKPDKESDDVDDDDDDDNGKTMSFGLIHEGTTQSLHNLMRVTSKLKSRPEVKFVDIRKITIRGATREQVNYDPQTFSWADYDQRPGLEQFYGQRAVGLQSVFQLGMTSKKQKYKLSSAAIAAAFKGAIESIQTTLEMDKSQYQKAIHNIGQGAVYVALLSDAQVVVTWDGEASININIFTYDESVHHYATFSEVFLKGLLPRKLKLNLSDQQPRGYGKVITKSDRVNTKESPECYDHYKLCSRMAKSGKCKREDKKDWMLDNCKFSCGQCVAKKHDEL